MSLLVDTNAEYDLSSLLGMTSKGEMFQEFTEEFFEAEESEKIMIHIETISKTISNFRDPLSTPHVQHIFLCASQIKDQLP